MNHNTLHTEPSSAWRGKSGFTLTEVMVASSLTLLLTLSIFETAMFCNRAGYDIKSRLSADALAFDTVWELYNRPLSWFEQNATTARSGWLTIDPDRTSTWGERGNEVQVFWSVVPEGLPPVRWRLTTNVRWPSVAGGDSRMLPTDYMITRERTNRKVFMTGN